MCRADSTHLWYEDTFAFRPRVLFKSWCVNCGRERALTPLERFMNKTRPDTSGCLLWTGARKGSALAYGAFRCNSVTWYAHRWIFQEKRGYLPEAVMHKCDTPLCVNWERCLIGGTRLQNMEDMGRKGRSRSTKLTVDQVQQIRIHWSSGKSSQRDLATAYGVHASSVRAIVLRKSWKHVS